MQVDGMAGIVRLQPGGSASPSAAQKKGRQRLMQDAPPQQKDGAKEATPKAGNNQMEQDESANASGSLMNPREWRLPERQRSLSDWRSTLMAN